MLTLADQIESFRVKPENLNIPFMEFYKKLKDIGVLKVVMPNTKDESQWNLFIAPGKKSSIYQVRKTGNYKRLLSDLIKKHVVTFDEVRWK